MDDETMREQHGSDASAERSDVATAVDAAFVKTPDTARGVAGTTAGASAEDRNGNRETVLDHDRAESFRRRWDDIQTGFVDRPRESVEQADRLVLEVVQQLQASFTLARERLESQWSEGGDASTEDLRQSLRRYRFFFDRLLSA